MIPAPGRGHTAMNRVTAHLSISLDGFAAGPNQSLENPIGEGGMQLHEWVFGTASWRAQHGLEGGADDVDSKVVERLTEGVGAYVMGRRMFGGGDGPWDDGWRGWWGEDPPFHVPVFVLSHHPRAPLTMQGGTTFTFVDGVDRAHALAREAAADADVAVAGGASTVNQFLAAGLLDELQLHIVPVLLGAGERLFEGLAGTRLELAGVVASPAVTHVTYRPRR
jgi:dihydrofolate reductase